MLDVGPSRSSAGAASCTRLGAAWSRAVGLNSIIGDSGISQTQFRAQSNKIRALASEASRFSYKAWETSKNTTATMIQRHRESGLPMSCSDSPGMLFDFIGIHNHGRPRPKLGEVA